MSNRIKIVGTLPSCCKDMIACNKLESGIDIDKVLLYNPIDPNNIDWTKVTRDSWFICIEPKSGKNYSFPILEEENRDNNYHRAKMGMKHFVNLLFKVYSIGC